MASRRFRAGLPAALGARPQRPRFEHSCYLDILSRRSTDPTWRTTSIPRCTAARSTNANTPHLARNDHRLGLATQVGLSEPQDIAEQGDRDGLLRQLADIPDWRSIATVVEPGKAAISCTEDAEAIALEPCSCRDQSIVPKTLSGLPPARAASNRSPASFALS